MKVPEFYSWDYQKTLFPLETNRLSILFGDELFRNFVKTDAPLNLQLPASALKRGGGNRETVKLDPVMDFIFYDFILRNNYLFLGNMNHRRHASYGYHFSNEAPVSTAKSYNRFQNDLKELCTSFKYFIKLDVKSYFNSIQLKDFRCWLHSLVGSDECKLIDRCFDVINASSDSGFLPQGIFPSKVLGANYLSFLEQSPYILADRTIRFADDIYLFSNFKEVMLNDFHFVQHELLERGLSINADKSRIDIGSSLELIVHGQDERISLNRKRLQCFEVSDGEFLFDGTQSRLNDAERDYIVERAESDYLHESDITLILTFLRDDADKYLVLFKRILFEYPEHSKSLYYFAKYFKERDALLDVIMDYVICNDEISEYQLFWIVKSIIYLSDWKGNAEYLVKIYFHPSASSIVKAKIIEVPSRDERLKELSRQHFEQGNDLLKWCGAFGLREDIPMIPISNNTLPSDINNLIMNIIRNAEGAAPVKA